MHQYGVREVEQLLGLPRSTIRGLVQAGFVVPARGPRNALLFSFQDLIVLRAARALRETSLSPRRINRSLKQLRRLLPESLPLSGLNICAVADRVVVRQGDSRWQADSGQYLLALEVELTGGVLRIMERGEPGAEPNGEEWFSRGWALEQVDAKAAQDAYAQALAAHPAHLGAAINLGRMLHESGRLAEAEQVYRDGLTAGGSDALLHYNLGVLLEDLDRLPEAAQAYETALRNDPDMADCHYNLALVYEALNRPRQAIRHLARYRKLAADDPG